MQERGLTLNKHRFRIFKIRTLADNNHKFDKHSKVSELFYKPDLKHKVTPYGGWLRKSGLDELPQLVNIILGHMSLIGPRPLMLDDLKILKKHFPNQYKERELISAKPGISGLWQLFGDRKQGVDNLIGLDLVYDRYKSVYLDFKLFLSTIPLMILGRNSDAILTDGQNKKARDIVNLLSISSRFKLKIDSLSLHYEKQKLNQCTIELPDDWWYVNDSYKVMRETESSLRIIKMNNDSQKSSHKAS